MKTFYTVYNTEEGFFKGCDEPDMILMHGGYDLPEATELAETLAQKHPNSVSVVFQVVKACTSPKPEVHWNDVEQEEPKKKFRLVIDYVDSHHLIETIKVLRTYTDEGLKECKQTVDMVRFSGKCVVDLPRLHPDQHMSLLDDLARVKARAVIEEHIGHSDLWKVVNYQ